VNRFTIGSIVGGRRAFRARRVLKVKTPPEGVAKPIQSRAPVDTAWIPATGGATILRMPLDLTDVELDTAARACRALAHRGQESAKAISDPALRGPVQKRAQCAAALAERFEAARTRNRK
jgi:hypothetical protein